VGFYELHCRSAFSFLASGSVPEDFVHRAAELGINGIAILDRDTVSGAVRLHLEAKEAGIKPIIGSEITLENGSLLPLIPISLKGYQNLCRLITTVKLRSKKGQHFAARTDIEEHSQDLICLTGGPDGMLWRSIKDSSSQKDLAWLNYVFERRLYVELQRHYMQKEEYVNQHLLGLAHKFRLPYFASNGAYYAHPADRELFDVFTCIKNKCTIADAGYLLSENDERYLKSKPQLLTLFKELPEAVERTDEIVSRVQFSMDELGYTFPTYPVPQGETMDSLLRKLSEKGAIGRYGSLTSKVRGKLDKELTLIEKLKLAGYFLVVSDISEFCRANNILSQGRGSAANSVVCYSLGITAVDPIEADLLFERFLSAERDEFPDIDIDLPSGDDRELVIQHVYEKYGERGAGMTANVITYRGRSAIREVGKVFGFDEEHLGILAKSVSHYGSQDTEEMLARFTEAGFDHRDDLRTRKFVEQYARILDFPRHLGQHSGGMVISLGRLDGIVPLEPASMEGRRIIQWDKDDCERLGIIKVDLLGLGMMAVIRDTLTLIREHQNENVDLAKIPKDDPLVYKTLQNADTIGMFQVESRAQIAFLPKSRPETFYDLVVQVAIIRPGPVVGKMLSGYLARRQGIEPIDYLHPSFEPFLKRTLGVPLFQEQLLRMAMAVAGFSGGEAEELRRALGFKRADKRLGRIEEKLRAGMTDRGIAADVQDKIVKNILAFASYGFPESHAASFALLTYASAYLKVHYLAAFTTAMLNNYPLGFYSPATLIKDAERHGLVFKPIDINESDHLCTIDDEHCVRIGLRYVKGLRTAVAEEIVAERERGPFQDVEEFVRRVPAANRRDVRGLSLSGAFDLEANVHRRLALWQSELATRPAGELFRNVPVADREAAFIRPMSGLELVETDMRSTTVSLREHPMAFIRDELKGQGVLSASDTMHLQKKDIVSVAGAVIVRQRPGTAKGVVFITLEDETGHSNFIVMPDTFERFRPVIVQNSFLLIRGIAEEGGLIKGLFFEPIGTLATNVHSHDFH
jgi:error-prone DNA polymerase